jgi:choline dehydrogenase-like flavoprotein
VNGHFLVDGLTSEANKRYMSILCAYTHTFSRGTVHIVSKDITYPPAIQQNYLSNPADLHILVKLLAFTMRLYKTKPITDLVERTVTPVFVDDTPDNDEALRTTEYSCYCAPSCWYCFNAELIVYGTTNLRVVSFHFTFGP